MNPLVTVLIPVYNGTKTLKKALESVFSQTFVDYEVLIIDDGSTDNLEDFLKTITDSRLRYIKNESNLGIQKSLNRGLKDACGRYIARLDADDYWVITTKLDEQVKFLEDNPEYVLVGTFIESRNIDGSLISKVTFPTSDSAIRKQVLLYNCFAHPTVMFRKAVALSLRGYSESSDMRHVEDYDLWLRMGLEGKLANLPLFAGAYTLDPSGISTQNKIEQLKKFHQISNKYRHHYPSHFLIMLLRNFALLVSYMCIALIGEKRTRQLYRYFRKILHI